MGMLSTVATYYEVTKPKIWYLLVFTALGGAVVAGGPLISPWTLGLVISAVAAGSAGANVITSYIDRDIDAVMNRTRGRPLPTGRIAPASRALYYGLGLSGLAIVLALWLSPVAGVLMSFGLADNIIVYSKILKRRNPLSIILGGFSGGIPAVIGYVAVTQRIDLFALILGALVVLWIPTHIWSLALHSRDDYARAGVPMLPVVVSERVAVRCIASTTILMTAFSLFPFLSGYAGVLYLAAALPLAAGMLALNFWLIARPSRERAWTVFKFSSPYLTLLFVALMADALVR
jgi:protoheme IX farnesyltransferase